MPGGNPAPPRELLLGEAVNVLDRQVEGEVDVAGFEHGGAGVDVGDAQDDDLVEVGKTLLPVVGVLGEDEALVGDELETMKGRFRWLRS